MRYSLIKYDGAKYGLTSHPNLLWALEVDWDGDGVFDGQNEAIYITSLQTSRGRAYLLRSDGSGFEPVAVSTVDIDLNNRTGRFDAWNIHSPLYGQILPGRKFRLSVTNTAGGTRYPIMAGIVQDLRPASGDINRAVFRGVCGIQWLRDRDVTSAMQQNISIGSAIDRILTAADWPAMWGRSIETNIDELPYWWVEGKNAFDEIMSLADHGLGTFFTAADGSAKFYTRHHIADPVLTLDQSQLNEEAIISQPWESIRNRIQIVVYNRSLQATGDLWSYLEKPWIGAGETLELTAHFQTDGSGVPAQNVISPIATTDYTFHTKADSSDPGIENLTADLVVSINILGNMAEVTLTNNGTKGGYVTFLRIRGDAFKSGEPITVTEENTTSQSSYGPRVFRLDTPWMQSVSAAMSYADFLLSFLSSPHPFPAIQIEGRPDIQFLPDLFDVITLTLPAKGISQNFRVGQIEHRWISDTGQAVRTTLALEPFIDIAGEYWQFPTEIGETSIFAF